MNIQELKKGNWTFNIEKTQDRIQKLSDFYKRARLNADDFACKKYLECLNSIREGCVKQYNGGTCAVSPLYDTYYGEIPIRIMIVGKEMAYMKNKPYGTSTNFKENCQNVLNCIGWKKKNNHIKGTLMTLENIFGVESEYVYSNYVLSNLLRCSYQKNENKNKVSSVPDTKRMRDNCIEYLIEEIKILEPTIVICQGEWAIKGKYPIVKQLSKYFGEEYKTIMTNNNEKYGLYQFDNLYLLTSHHPAILGNWIKNLAPDSVWPMLDYLREIGYLPKVDLNDISDYKTITEPYINDILKNLDSNDLLRS